jgi:hypothetical protein
MTFSWDQILRDSLTGLTAAQHSALDCFMSSKSKSTTLGIVRLKSHGFQTLEEYEAPLNAARATVKRYFAIRGVHYVHDLDFEVPEESTEGRIQQIARRVMRKAPA